MAYRYNRINWQNKPNVATPISAENLNKMDKGIDDNDKAIGDLAQLNTSNKSSLVSAVNELNDNLDNLSDKLGRVNQIIAHMTNADNEEISFSVGASTLFLITAANSAYTAQASGAVYLARGTAENVYTIKISDTNNLLTITSNGTSVTIKAAHVFTIISVLRLC